MAGREDGNNWAGKGPILLVNQAPTKAPGRSPLPSMAGDQDETLPRRPENNTWVQA